MSSSTPQRVAVLGSSFAGMTAALEMRKQLDDRHDLNGRLAEVISERVGRAIAFDA